MIGIIRNAEVQTGIRCSVQIKLLIGMVQEVEGREPELQTLTFPESGHIEVFVDSQIRIEECRAVYVRPNQRSILALSRNRKAGRVKVLARPQSAAWIARQLRH